MIKFYRRIYDLINNYFTEYKMNLSDNLYVYKNYFIERKCNKILL